MNTQIASQRLRRPLQDLLRAPLRPSWVLFGALLVLGPSWGPRGVPLLGSPVSGLSCTSLEASLGRLLGPSSALVGGHAGSRENSEARGVEDPSRTPLQPLLDPLGSSLGPSWALLGPSWGPHGGPEGGPGGVPEGSWSPLASESYCGPLLDFSWGPSWAPLGPLLGLSWGPSWASCESPNGV